MVYSPLMKTLSEPDIHSAPLKRKNAGFLVETLRQSEPFRELLSALKQPPSNKREAIDIAGIHGSLAPLLSAAIHAATDEPVVILAAQSSFELYLHDLSSLVSGNAAFNTSDELPAAIEALRKRVCRSSFRCRAICWLHFAAPGNLKAVCSPLQWTWSADTKASENSLPKTVSSNGNLLKMKGSFPCAAQLWIFFPLGRPSR